MDKWAYAARLIGVGFFISASIILGLLLGLWLDSRFHTNLIWIGGLLLGIIVAAIGLYRMLIPLLDNNKKNNHGRGG